MACRPSISTHIYSNFPHYIFYTRGSQNFSRLSPPGAPGHISNVLKTCSIQVVLMPPPPQPGICHSLPLGVGVGVGRKTGTIVPTLGTPVLNHYPKCSPNHLSLSTVILTSIIFLDERNFTTAARLISEADGRVSRPHIK